MERKKQIINGFEFFVEKEDNPINDINFYYISAKDFNIVFYIDVNKNETIFWSPINLESEKHLTEEEFWRQMKIRSFV